MCEKISIVITHYENPSGLEKLLESIYGEGLDYEIIVVDDCSKIQLEDLEQVKQKYYKVIWIKNRENKGPGLSRNIGIAVASRKWILLADSDDEFLHGFSKIVGNYVSSGKDLIYFLPKLNRSIVNSIDYRNKYVRLIDDFFKKNKNAEINIRTQFGIGHSKMIRRSLIIDNHLTYDDRKMFEDSLFNLKVGLIAKKIGVDGRSIYKINEEKNSLSSKKNRNYNKDYTEVMVERYLFEKKHLNISELKSIRASKFNLYWHVFATTRKISYLLFAMKKSQTKMF